MPKKKSDNFDMLSSCFWNCLLFTMNHRLQLLCKFLDVFCGFTFKLSGFTQWTSCCTITQLFTFTILIFSSFQVVLTEISIFRFRF